MGGISNLSVAEVNRLTYRDAWVRYFLPALRARRDELGETPEVTDPGAQRAFIDQICQKAAGAEESAWIGQALTQIEAKQRAKKGT